MSAHRRACSTLAALAFLLCSLAGTAQAALPGAAGAAAHRMSLASVQVGADLVADQSGKDGAEQDAPPPDEAAALPGTGVLEPDQLRLISEGTGLPQHLSRMDGAMQTPEILKPKVHEAPPGSLMPSARRLRGYERAPVAPFAEGRHNYLIPALEVLVFNFGLLALNNYVGQQDFARVRWDDITAHFDGRAGWQFDVDYFPINMLGHPYQGALAHTAARSSGLSFWEGFLYATASSLLWEYFLERDPPSINDQITTPLAGLFLGEALHRSFRYLVDDTDGRNSTFNRVAAAFISPASAFNHWLYEDQMDRRDFSSLATHLGVAKLGATLSTTVRSNDGGAQQGLFRQGPQAYLGGELHYGVPTDGDRDYTVPFSHYVVSADVAFPREPLLNLFIRGLLTGQRYGSENQGLHGLWGLYGLYDMSANHTVRVSTVGIGVGSTLRARVGGGNQVHLTAVAGSVAFGAAGSLGLESEHERDYQIGPGVSGIFEAAFVRPGLGSVGVKAHSWNIVGLYAEPRDGSEWVTYAALEARLRVLPRLSVGLDLPFMARVYRLAGNAERERTEVGATPRLVVTFSTDDILFTESP